MLLLTGDPLLMIALLGGGGVIAGLFWYFSAHQRAIRKIRGVAITRVADAKDGEWVRLVGTVQAGTRTLSAPLSGRACGYFDVQVQVRVSRGKSSHWRSLFHEIESVDFVLDDGSGQAQIQTQHFSCAVVRDHHRTSGTFNDAGEDLIELLARHGHEPTNMLGMNKTMRYDEGVLEPGEQIAVIGRARWEDDPSPGAVAPASGGYRGSNRAKRLVLEASDQPVHASDDPKALTLMEPCARSTSPTSVRRGWCSLSCPRRAVSSIERRSHLVQGRPHALDREQHDVERLRLIARPR